MTTLNVSITTVKQALAAGVIAGAFRFSLLAAQADPAAPAAPAIAIQDEAAPAATFTGVLPGDYVITAVRVDSNGNPISALVSAAVTVPVPAEFDAPATISVALA